MRERYFKSLLKLHLPKTIPMKLHVKKILITALLFGATLSAFAQVDIKAFQQNGFVSVDTLYVTIDASDNSGTGGTSKIVYFNIYNLSVTHAESFYLEAEWLCSNSSAFYQFCQEYPPDYNSGTCHTFHRDGQRVYADYNYSIAPDTCSYNYLRCHFFIFDYSVEQEHEKICRFLVKRRNTNEVLDSMYLVIRRGNLPCSGATSLHTPSVDDVAEIYPNPARNSFTIATKQDQLMGYSLYSPDGKILLDKNVEHAKMVNINVKDLSNGIYYLKLTDRNRKSFYKKIVVDN
jgi:hypothetical protein